MRAFGFSALLIIFAIQLGAWRVARSQNVTPFGERPEVFGEESAETERLPRFEVEVVAFAYNAFDPNEEQFHRDPRPNPLEAQPVDPVAPLEAEPSQTIDRYQRLSPPPSTSSEPPLSTAGPRYPSYGDTDTDDALGPSFGGELPPAQVVEEELSVSQRILSTLLIVEEELGPRGPPTDPLEPNDPRNAPNDPLSEPRDLPPQDATGEPSPLDLIAVQRNFGQFSETEEPEEEPFQFQFLSREELELTAAAARLDRLDAYTVLVHGGWVQEGLPEERAKPFNIGLLGTFNPLGTVKLHLSRFLHVTVALDYQARPPTVATPFQPQFPAYDRVLEEFSLPQVFELRATRRTRSGELHYFDHPAFGLLVVVRPAPEIPEESEDTEGSLSPPLGPAA